MDEQNSANRFPDALRRIKFSWIIENEIAGMARPREGAFEALAEIGVRAIVALETNEILPAGELGIAYLHVPVGDFTPPTMEQFMTILAFLKRYRPAVVHCLVGHGRTGTVLASYLVAEHGFGATEAIQKIRQIRPGSIETKEQENFVSQVFEELGSQSG